MSNRPTILTSAFVGSNSFSWQCSTSSLSQYLYAFIPFPPNGSFMKKVDFACVANPLGLYMKNVIECSPSDKDDASISALASEFVKVQGCFFPIL